MPGAVLIDVHDILAWVGFLLQCCRSLGLVVLGQGNVHFCVIHGEDLPGSMHEEREGQDRPERRSLQGDVGCTTDTCVAAAVVVEQQR